VQFGSALFDFGEGGYMGAMCGSCGLRHDGRFPPCRSGRAGNQRGETALPLWLRKWLEAARAATQKDVDVG
jgi:hypothetical protein